MLRFANIFNLSTLCGNARCNLEYWGRCMSEVFYAPRNLTGHCGRLRLGAKDALYTHNMHTYYVSLNELVDSTLTYT